MTLLLACGGGGGGGAAAVNPLTQFRATPNSPSIEAVEEIADSTGANIFVSNLIESESFGSERGTVCGGGISGNPSCTVTPPDILDSFVVSPANLTDLSFIENDVFFREYSSRISGSATVGDVTLARGQLTGTSQQGSTPLAFQTFSGWLDGSIFGTIQMSVGESGNERYRFFSYIAGGTSSDSNPTGTGEATWEGVTVATIKADRTFIQGDATITIPDLASADVDITLDNWLGISGQRLSSMEAISYEDLTLTDGAFEGSGNDQVQGRFYGTDHAEVGGFFNTADITGAFGGTRQ